MSIDALRAHLDAGPPVRLIYTDVDGTLTGPDGSLLTSAGGEPMIDAARALCAAAAAGVTVVPVSGRQRRQLALEARLLGLRDFVAEAGCVTVRDAEVSYAWGACPPGLGATPHEALEASGAVDALLEAFRGDLRPYAPWHQGREGSHLLHGVVDVGKADTVLAEAGVEWAHLVDNGATRGWPGRAVRAYHLLPRGVGKQPAVAGDLRARGLAPGAAMAIGDSPHDRTMAHEVRTYVQVAGGHGEREHRLPNAFTVPGEMGAGFAQAVEVALASGDGR